MNDSVICQYVIQGCLGFKAEKLSSWTICLAEALPFESQASAISYINEHLKLEHSRSPNFKVLQVKPQFIRTQFASFNMWQALQLEKAVLVLSPDSVATENWTKAQKDPGSEPAVFTWVDCYA